MSRSVDFDVRTRSEQSNHCESTFAASLDRGFVFSRFNEIFVFLQLFSCFSWRRVDRATQRKRTFCRCVAEKHRIVNNLCSRCVEKKRFFFSVFDERNFFFVFSFRRSKILTRFYRRIDRDRSATSTKFEDFSRFPFDFFFMHK